MSGGNGGWVQFITLHSQRPNPAASPQSLPPGVDHFARHARGPCKREQGLGPEAEPIAHLPLLEEGSPARRADPRRFLAGQIFYRSQNGARSKPAQRSAAGHGQSSVAATSAAAGAQARESGESQSGTGERGARRSAEQSPRELTRAPSLPACCQPASQPPALLPLLSAAAEPASQELRFGSLQTAHARTRSRPASSRCNCPKGKYPSATEIQRKNNPRKVIIRAGRKIIFKKAQLTKWRREEPVTIATVNHSIRVPPMPGGNPR